MDTGEQLVEQDAEREDVGPGVRLGPEQLLGRHWPFVLAEAQRHGVSIAKPDIVDPLVIDRAVDRYRRGSRRLDAVAAHYGHDPAQAHDARTDAIARALGAQYSEVGDLTPRALQPRQASGLQSTQTASPAISGSRSTLDGRCREAPAEADRWWLGRVDVSSRCARRVRPLLTFSASVEFHIVMSPDELARADLDELGKKWG